MFISAVDIARPPSSARPSATAAGDSVGAAGSSGSALDRDTQDALRRFAKFVKRDPQKRPKANVPSAAAKYRAGWQHEPETFERGQILNIYI